MNEQVMKDLEAKVEELAADFKAFALGKLTRVNNSGVGVGQDHQENANNWVTPRQFVAAAAQEFAETVTGGRLTKQATHNIKQYRIHM
jgi:hypothetical protein